MTLGPTTAAPSVWFLSLSLAGSLALWRRHASRTRVQDIIGTRLVLLPARQWRSAYTKRVLGRIVDIADDKGALVGSAVIIPSSSPVRVP